MPAAAKALLLLWLAGVLQGMHTSRTHIVLCALHLMSLITCDDDNGASHVSHTVIFKMPLWTVAHLMS